jgi:high affinity sulfate transporter 1
MSPDAPTPNPLRRALDQLNLFQGLRPFIARLAVRDVIAGVVLAALDIPQALGYTRIAGMPVVTGLYTLLLPLVAFAALGSSRYLVVAADSATAAILAGGLTDLAPTASPRYVSLAALVALLTAAFLLLGRLLKLGFIADFLSQPVLAGFLTGVGFQVGISVLAGVLGIPVQSRRTPIKLLEVIRGLPHLHLPTVLVSAAVLIAVLLLRKFTPRIPGPLLAVIAATAASALWHFDTHGILTVGPVAGGLPHLGMHDIVWRDIPSTFAIAGSCAIMILTQSSATSRIYAARHHQNVDPNRDLVGLSAANLASAFSGAFVVNGSPTQTALLESAGGQSQLAQITTASVVALVLLFLTELLQYLPQCVLATLVLIVAIKLVDIRSLREIRKESPNEFALAIATAAVVVTIGVEQGIILAMIASLFRIVHHSYHPLTGVLVPQPDDTFKLVPTAPGLETIPDLVLYRFGATLFYANVARFADEILLLAGPMPSPVRWIIVDAEAITRIDYSAARIIISLIHNLSNAGISLGFARLPWDAKADFYRHHLAEAVDPTLIFDRLRDVQETFQRIHLDRTIHGT